MNMKVIGVNDVLSDLSRFERKAVKSSTATVKKYAEIIGKQAAKNAPVKDGYLEDSLEILGEEKSPDHYSVTVGVNDKKLGPGYQGGFDYHVHMHDSEYNLGSKSIEKANAGNDVGHRYLDRAVLSFEQELIDTLNENLRDAI